MKQIKLSTVKQGEFFTLKPCEYPKESQVLVRDEYNRADKDYSCRYWNDANKERFLKGSRLVYVDFVF